LLKGNKVNIVRGEAFFVDAIHYVLWMKIQLKPIPSKMPL